MTQVRAQPPLAAGRTTRWVNPPPVVVRVAGLPVKLVDGLQCPATAAAMNHLLAAQDALRGLAADLGQDLHDVIRDAPSPAKPALVGLRRRLHAGRPIAREVAGNLPHLPPGLARRLLQWDRRRAQAQELREQLSDMISADRQGVLASLRDTAADPGLAHALVSVCPNLYRTIRPWAERERGNPPQRRDLITLTRYLTRMSTKTSPRSTFTWIGLGRWREEVGDPAAVLEQAPLLVAEAHSGVLQAIAGALARDPRLAGRSRARPNPSLTRFSGRLWWVRPLPQSPLLSVVATPALESCLAAAQAAPTIASLRAGARDQFRAVTPEAADAFLDQLIMIGVLEPYLAVPDQHDDPLAALLAALEGCAGAVDVASDLGLVRAALERAHHDLRAIPASTPAEHLRRRAGVEEALGQAAVLSGALPVAAPLPQGTGLFDSAVLSEPVPLDPHPWSVWCRDLEATACLTGLFDPKLPFRLALARLVASRFGPDAAVPFLALFRLVQGDQGGGADLAIVRSLRTLLSPDVEQRALAAAAAWDDRIADLLRLRREFVDGLDGLADPAAADEGVVRISSEAVRAARRRWPTFVVTPGSLSLYVQRTELVDSPLVVNAVETGHGHGISRAKRLVEGTRGSLPELAQHQPPDELLYAELDHVFGNTVNRRQASTAYAIDYPGFVSDRPAERLIPLGELVVVSRGSGSDLRLAWATPGRWVKPVYTAAMWELLLPPAARLLVDGFAEPPTFVPPNSWWLTPPVTEPLRDVQHYPRVQIGGVVVRRACWLTQAHRLPIRNAGEDDLTYQLALGRWLRHHNLPTASYVRVLPADGTRIVKERKPMLLDIASPFLVLSLETSIRARDDLVFFTEELPTRAAAPGGRVTEYVVQLDSLGGRGA
ncbi:MAG: Lanthionine biosynthesis protein [Marmoricola sp.]|nr:Lanthionine biosynthesis protein [Marmoricola sp.]